MTSQKTANNGTIKNNSEPLQHLDQSCCFHGCTGKEREITTTTISQSYIMCIYQYNEINQTESNHHNGIHANQPTNVDQIAFLSWLHLLLTLPLSLPLPLPLPKVLWAGMRLLSGKGPWRDLNLLSSNVNRFIVNGDGSPDSNGGNGSSGSGTRNPKFAGGGI